LSLTVAAVVALVFQPYYQWLHDRMPQSLALVTVFLSVLFPIVAFGWFFGALLVDQIVGLVSRAPELWSDTTKFAEAKWPAVRDFLNNHPFGVRVKEVLESQGQTLLQGVEIFGKGAWSAGAGILRGAGALLSWAVLPVYIAFFLMADPRKLAKDPGSLLPFLKEETRIDVIYLGREFVNIVVAFFRGQLLIAFLMGVLFAIGFSLVGLKYGLVLGLLLGFLNIIPYLGSIVGLSAALPLAFFQEGGGPRLILWVLVVFAIVQLIEGYVLTPKVMGERTGLHPMAIIVSVFFWGAAFDGIMGMILAIPLTAFLVIFWRLAKEKYIGELL
jgi:predicted PurR-regulated permease PerM